MNRDVRIDAWRGLCLVDVVLVHLAYNGTGFPEPIDSLIKHYTRFAAGGFVFLAGLTVAVVFGPRVARGSAERWDTYRRLWRRAAFLVLVDVFASVAYRLVDGVRRFPAAPDTPLGEAFSSIVLLQRPGLTGGILLLYSLLLACMPAVFALRRRYGNWPIAAASGIFYSAALASDGMLHWPSNDFPVLYWQPLFFAGFLAAPVLARVLDLRHRLLSTISMAAAFACIFLIHHGPQFGADALAQWVPLNFNKTPLQFGAFLWYLSLTLLLLSGSLLVWDRLLRGGHIEGWLALLGRHSLVVYTAHVFTEILVLEYVWSAWPPATVRVIASLADIALLSALCACVEAIRLHIRRTAPSTVRSPTPRRWMQAAGALAYATCVLLALIHQTQRTGITSADSGHRYRSASETLDVENLHQTWFDEPSTADLVVDAEQMESPGEIPSESVEYAPDTNPAVPTELDTGRDDELQVDDLIDQPQPA